MFENKIKITAPFWQQYIKLVREEMLPFQWDVLNDKADIKIEKERDADYIPSEKSHAIENFKIAAGITQGHHYGMVFQDSDVYKWLEAVAYALHQHYDEDLRKIADGVVDLLAQAQEEDGYLNTYFTIEAPDRKYKRLYQSHELYCAGHFIEAAVGYFNVTGNKKILDIAYKLADNIDRHFGSEEGKIHGYDGHEEIELALLRLYELSHDEKYKKLAHFFLYERGKNPNFFKEQQKDDPSTKVLIEGMDGFKPSYYQNHKPILEQETAEGHAVRVMYMCTGMAMLARLDNDEAMLKACKRLWKNIVTKRMYITGGIGSTAIGEAFTADYDLPNDTMYCETCASIGLIFFADNMLKIEHDSQYADVMERALYNAVIDGMALDGKHFFYVNPLEVVPELSKKDPNKSHVKTTRPAWFGCSCCPPNLARLLSSLDEYMYKTTDDTIYANLYLSNEAQFKLKNKAVTLMQETNYPWNGKITFIVKNGAAFKLALRIPAWAENCTLKVNNSEVKAPVVNGYAVLEYNWQSGDTVVLDLPMKAQFIGANPLIREDRSKVAVQRGPVVYCAESVDNGANLQLLQIDTQAPITEEFKTDLFGGVVSLSIKGSRIKLNDNWQDKLYQPVDEIKDTDAQTDIKLIPYFTCLNRGETEMTVWLHKK